MNSEQLPERWNCIALEEVCEIILGNSPPGESYNESGDGVPFIQGAKVFGKKEPKTDRFTSEPTKICDEGDILITTRATVGDLNWADKSYCIGRGATALRPGSELNDEFLYYYLQTKEVNEYWEKMSSGSTYSSITKKDLQNLHVPVPPLPEQQAITDRLNFIFDKIDEAREAQKAAEEIEEDLLFSMFLDLVDEADTKLVQTGDVINESQYGISEAMNEENKGYPILRMGNYDSKGNMDYSDLKHVELSDKELEKYKLNKGDVLFNRTNSKKLVGKTAIYDGKLDDAVFASYLIRVHLDKNKVLPEYFVNYLNSPRGQAELDKKAKQSVSQANINATELRELDFELPTLSKQREIIKRFESLETQIEKIRSMSDRIGEILSELPIAALHKAFHGELVDYEALEGEEHKIDKPPHTDRSSQVSLEDF